MILFLAFLLLAATVWEELHLDIYRSEEMCRKFAVWKSKFWMLHHQQANVWWVFIIMYVSPQLQPVYTFKMI